LAVMCRFSCTSCPFLAGCPSFMSPPLLSLSALLLSYFHRPVLVYLFCPGHPVLGVAFRLSYAGCPACCPAQGCPYMAD
jgi:hypothetical protein